MIESESNTTEGSSMSTGTMIAPEKPAAVVFDTTAHDRCDRCGARAYVEAKRGTDVLLFCGHHGRAHEPVLIAQGFIVRDAASLATLK